MKHLDKHWPKFSDILKAYQKCRLRKKFSPHQTQFEARLGENLLALHREIHSRTYAPSISKCFVVLEPRPREIFAAHFRDRIVHHLIVGVLESSWEKKFSYSSFACRNKKGSYQAIRYLGQKALSLSQGGHKSLFCLQMDLASFFVTVHRPTLEGILTKEIRHPTLKWLTELTYLHDPRTLCKIESSKEKMEKIPPHKSWFNQLPEFGIPIGNLTSQFGANVYLNSLDHWIQRTLKPQAYIRYMDDLLLLDRDYEKLQNMISPIDQFLFQNRRQNLNPKKTFLKNLRQEFLYLGYFISQDDLGHIQLKVSSKKKWALIQSLKELESSPLFPIHSDHPLGFPKVLKKTRDQISSINARLGYIKHAKTYQVRKNSIEKLKEKLTNPQKIDKEYYDAWNPIGIKRGFKAIRLRSK